MKLLKHITAFFLLALFLVPVVSSVVLQLQQLYVQHQMEEALEQQQLVSIKTNTASLQWVRKNKECLINGELFDVKDIKQTGDEMIITGLFDVNEKAIAEIITRQTNEEQHNQSKQIAKLLLLVATPANETSIHIFLPSVLTGKQHFKLSFYIAPFKGNLTPPPKYS